MDVGDSPDTETGRRGTWVRAVGVFGALAVCLGILNASGASAQVPSGRGVFPPSGGDQEVLWQRLEEAADAEDWDTVVEGLTRRAEQLEAPEENAVVPTGAGMAPSLRWLFRRLVERLPDDARERYRRRLDSIVEPLWRDSLRSGERTHARVRHRILRDYKEATLYREALEEAIDGAFEEGRWSEALGLCREWLQGSGREQESATPPPGDLARVRLLLLHIHRALGDTAGADSQRAALEELVERESPDALGREVHEEIRRLLGSSTAPGEGISLQATPDVYNALQPLVLARSPATQERAVVYRLGTTLWTQRTDDYNLLEFVQERARRAPAGNVPLPYYPVTRDRMIIFRDTGRITLFDTGTREATWSKKVEEGKLPLGQIRAPLLGSDRCYYVSDTTIHAVELASGEQLWSKQFRYDSDAKVLRLVDAGNGAAAGNDTFRFSIAPPVHCHRDLVVAVSVRIEKEDMVFMARLDPEGRERWLTYLGSARSEDHLGLAAAGSPPLVKGGGVYHLTNRGFLASVDSFDGSILWLFEYPRLSSRGNREATRREDRWQPNPILHVAGSLIIAPQDSPFMMALDPDTGASRWRAPRSGETTLVGADTRACFLVGESVSAVAHSGERPGMVLWKYGPEETEGDPGQPVGSGFRPFGRPLLTPGALLVPTRDLLLRLSPVDGRLLGATIWEFGGGAGNIALNGRLLGLTNPGGFVLYGDLEAETLELTSGAGESPLGLLRKARHHLRHFAVEEALGVLRTWWEGAPPTPPPNSPLDHLRLDAAELVTRILERGARDEHEVELQRFRVRLERSPARKIRALLELAGTLERRSRPGLALEALHDALVLDNPETEYEALPLLAVGSREYICHRIRALREGNAGEDAFQRIEAQAAEVFRNAREKGSAAAMLNVLRLYPFTPAAAETYLELAQTFEERGNDAQAVETLRAFIEDFPRDRRVVKVKLEIAKLLRRMEDYAEAMVVCRDLLANHPSAPSGDAGETVAEYAGRLLEDLTSRSADGGQEPRFRFPVRMAWRSPADLHATSRKFLEPTGTPPEPLRDCFLTQSVEVIECRRTATGIPRWTVHLSLIPGFEFYGSSLGFRFPRTARNLLSGRYTGALLVLHDDRNLFAVDAVSGLVKWHVPFGKEAAAGEAGSGLVHQLREQLRGVAVTDEAIFATSKRGTPRLRSFNLTGELLWEHELPYEPSLETPSVHGETLYVYSQKPASIFLHDAATGERTGVLDPGEDWSILDLPPIELPGNRVLLPFARTLKLLDLASGRFVWSYSGDRSRITNVFYSPDVPGECVIVINRSNNWPGVVGLSLRDGMETWRYEKFPARDTRFSVFLEPGHAYVIHGLSRWQMLGLEIHKAPGATRATVTPMWPEEISLGMFTGGWTQRRLHIGADTLLFADPVTSVTAYNKDVGVPATDAAIPISRFLVEKGSFESALVKGKLILLTDGGDCAFEAEPVKRTIAGDTGAKLLESYLKQPGEAHRALRLAEHYFLTGDLNAAIAVLDRTLLSEEILRDGSSDARFDLSYLLDGIKEEKMKKAVPTIVSRRVETPLEIDGSIEDPWPVGTRLHLRSPTHVGTIPGPGKRRDWDGVEDISAVLYTAWDLEYFYVALDVSDDALFPFDKEAEYWKGDCLLIGLDPTGDGGYRQRGNDQLMTLALTVPKRQQQDKDREREDGQQGEGEGEEDEQEPEGNFSVKKKEDDSGAIYELALPWASFSRTFSEGRPPAPGYSFGLSLLLTDDDTGQEATKTLSLNPCHLLPRRQKGGAVWRFLIPNYFPKVVLE